MLGPLFFVSYLFSVLSPLPGLYLYVSAKDRAQSRFWWAVYTCLGVGLSISVRGPWAGLGFALAASLPAIAMGETLLRQKGPERAVLAGMLATLAGSGMAFLAGAWRFGLSPAAAFHELRVVFETEVRDFAIRLLQQSQNEWAEPTKAAIEQISKEPGVVLQSVPGLAISGLLLLCILPCVAVIRWNPKGFLRRAGIARDFLRKWRSPDWLVWPAIFCIAFLIFPTQYLTTAANNLTNPLLIIYFFHGMSILAYFLDSMRLRGPLRVPIYFFGIVLLYPMVVSFGFFDLWLNFRNRRRTAEEEEES